MHPVLFFALSFLLASCGLVKVEDPALAYRAGVLPTCGSKEFHDSERADMVALLDSGDTEMVHRWAVDYFKRSIPFPTGGILFVHASPLPDDDPDILFIYVFLEKNVETGYCDYGGTRGKTPFNTEFLGKYGNGYL